MNPIETVAGTVRTLTVTDDAPVALKVSLSARAEWIAESEKRAETQLGLEGAIAQAADAWYRTMEESQSKCADLVQYLVVYLSRFPDVAKATVLKLIQDTAKQRELAGTVTDYVRGGEVMRVVGKNRKNYAPMASKLYKLAAWDAGRFVDKDTDEGITALAAHGVTLGQHDVFYSVVDALRAGYGINVVDAAFTAVLRPRKVELENSENIFEQAKRKAPDLKVVIYDVSNVGKAGGRPTRSVKVCDTAAGIAGTVVGLMEQAKLNNTPFSKKQMAALLKAGAELQAEYEAHEDEDEG